MAGAGELGRVLGGLPAIASRTVAVLEQLETMAREGLTLAPETIAAIRPGRGPQNRWRTLALWVIAVDLHRILLGSASYLIAMHIISMISLLSHFAEDSWPA